jgi:hypothetical protein
VHKIARPHEVMATEILISPRLLSRPTSSAPRFQPRQMRLNFQVDSSVRRWAFAIKLGFLCFTLYGSPASAVNTRNNSDHAGARRCVA